MLDHYFYNPRHKPYLLDNVKIKENNKHKCPSGFDENRLHSHGLSMARKNRKFNRIFIKDL